MRTKAIITFGTKHHRLSMVTIEEISEEVKFIEGILHYLPRNEQREEEQKNENQEEQPERPKIVKTPNREKPGFKHKQRPKKAGPRPGFEGPRVVQKKRDS